MKKFLYLIHELCDGLYQAAVFLRKEAVSPLLLLQSLAVALPEKLHILTTVLRIHINGRTYIYIYCTRTHSYTVMQNFCFRVQKWRNLVGSSPQLSLQSCCLVVDFHLIVVPASLYEREFTSRLFFNHFNHQGNN